MLPDALLNIVSSALEFGAMIALSLTLFRLPIRYNISRIAFISIVLSIVYYFFVYTTELKQFPVLLTVLMVYTILIVLLMNLPFFYSLSLCFIGYLAGTVIEVPVTLIGIQLGLTTVELTETSAIHMTMIKLVSTVFIGLLAYWLQARKIGFMFILNRITFKESLKGYNFYISALLVVGLVFMQFVSMSFALTSIHKYFLGGLVIILLLSIFLSYRQNKKVIKEKYERLGRRKYERN